MGAWLTFLKERMPLPAYALLVGGLASSGGTLGGRGTDVETSAAPWIAFILTSAGLFLFFAVLRIMDEYKDYEKDLIAHPRRPLPRGLLAPAQVARMINRLAVVMLLYAVAVGLRSLPAGLCYLLITAYLWLMYREFHAGRWLANRPILYAASHQVIILPLCYFCVLARNPAAWLQQATLLSTLYFGLIVLGAFFAYEICRKLDPQAHPLLQTYLSHYGPAKTAAMALCTIALSAYGALKLSSGIFLWPLEGILIVALSLLFLAPNRFKVVEGMATASLALHVWAIPLGTWLKTTDLANGL